MTKNTEQISKSLYKLPAQTVKKNTHVFQVRDSTGNKIAEFHLADEARHFLITRDNMKLEVWIFDRPVGELVDIKPANVFISCRATSRFELPTD